MWWNSQSESKSCSIAISNRSIDNCAWPSLRASNNSNGKTEHELYGFLAMAFGGVLIGDMQDLIRAGTVEGDGNGVEGLPGDAGCGPTGVFFVVGRRVRTQGERTRRQPKR